MTDPRKIEALEKWLAVRRQGKNPDMTPCEPTHEEHMAFLCGWDAATPDMDVLAERFCATPLPATVRSDQCATMPDYPHRSGTNLLTVTEAKQMLAIVLGKTHD